VSGEKAGALRLENRHVQKHGKGSMKEGSPVGENNACDYHVKEEKQSKGISEASGEVEQIGQ